MRTALQAPLTLSIRPPAYPQRPQYPPYILALTHVADFNMQQQEQSDIAVQEQVLARQPYAARIQRIRPLPTPMLAVDLTLGFVLLLRAASRHHLLLQVFFAVTATAS